MPFYGLAENSFVCHYPQIVYIDCLNLANKVLFELL